MRHLVKGRKLGRTASHRKATLMALSVALIKSERIVTTLAKAKALRSYVEPIITRSKEDSTHNRSHVFRHLRDKQATSRLFDEIAPMVEDRPGGYTRIIKLGARLGDGAEKALVELVDFNDAQPDTSRKKKRRTRRGGAGGKKDAAKSPGAKIDAAKPKAPKESQMAPSKEKEKAASQAKAKSADADKADVIADTPVEEKKTGEKPAEKKADTKAEALAEEKTTDTKAETPAVEKKTEVPEKDSDKKASDEAGKKTASAKSEESAETDETTADESDDPDSSKGEK